MTRDEALALSVPFGKFKGKTLGKVLQAEPTYLKWLSTKVEIQSPDLKEAVGILTSDNDGEPQAQDDSPPPF